LVNGFFASAQIKRCYAEIRSFPPFAISAKFFRRDFNLGKERSTFPDGPELSPLSDPQPHLIVTRKRRRYEYLECFVVLFSDDGGN